MTADAARQLLCEHNSSTVPPEPPELVQYRQCIDKIRVACVRAERCAEVEIGHGVPRVFMEEAVTMLRRDGYLVEWHTGGFRDSIIIHW